MVAARLVAPAAAAAGALVMATAPIFWGYGAIAGNYTAILAVGGFLLGVACRTWTSPEPWHPAAAAVVLALGTGYRQDIGTLWLPVLLVILWKHRWRPAVLAGLLFTLLNLAWLLAMLHEAGGWSRYRAQTAEFAYHAGYLNSVWNLGLVDAPLRYAVKLSMALLWTLGPCLLFVPRGIRRLRGRENGGFLAFLLFLSVLPVLASHMLVHFGVPGYAFHYVPALLALCVLGIGAMDCASTRAAGLSGFPGSIGTAPSRLVAVATLLAALFLFYPTDYDHAGWRGSFDLSFARLTRVGLRTPISNRQPALWRTANSPVSAELAARKREAGRVRYWQCGQAEKSPDLAISDLSRFASGPVLSRFRTCPASVPVPLLSRWLCRSASAPRRGGRTCSGSMFFLGLTIARSFLDLVIGDN